MNRIEFLASYYGKEHQELKTLEELSQDRSVDKYMKTIEEVNQNPDFREFMSAEEDNRKIENSLRREAIEQGLEQGKFDTIINLYNAGSLSLDVAARELGLTNEEFLSKINNIN